MPPRASSTRPRNTSSRLASLALAPGHLPAEFGQRAFGDEAAVGDDADTLGHALGDLQNMRRHQHRGAGAHRAR